MKRELIEGITELTPIKQNYILRSIEAEIKNQSSLWGKNRHYLSEWFTLVLKQIGQIAEAIIKDKTNTDLTHQIFQAITLLIQIDLGTRVF